MNWPIIIISIFSALMVFTLVYGIITPTVERPKDKIKEAIYGSQKQSSDKGMGKIVEPILENVMLQLPAIKIKEEQKNKIEDLLIKSNNPWKIATEEFIVLSIVLGIGGFLLGSLLSVIGITFSLHPVILTTFLIASGITLPYLMHKEIKDKRNNDIKKDLPTVLDLLTVSMSAGQTFQPALKKVCEQMENGTLKEELNKLSIDLSSGMSLERGLTLFNERNDVEEAKNFAHSLIQSDLLGADVNETLRQQSEAARMSQEGRLQKKIAKLSSTLTVPMLITSFPSFLMIFVAPTMSSFMLGG